MSLSLAHTLTLGHALTLVHLALVHTLALHLVLALHLAHGSQSLVLGNLCLGLVRSLLTLALSSSHAHVTMGSCGSGVLLSEHNFNGSQTLLLQPDLVQLLLELLTTIIGSVGVANDLLHLLHGLLPFVLCSA